MSPWEVVKSPQVWLFLFCLRSGREPRKPVEEYLGGRRGEGAGGQLPGHVPVCDRIASSCEHDLPGVLHGDGTGVLTVVLQVKLSSPCTLGSLLSYNTRLYSTTTSYKPHCPTTQ